jgi:hypothetical protein
MFLKHRGFFNLPIIQALSFLKLSLFIVKTKVTRSLLFLPPLLALVISVRFDNNL